MSEAYNKMTIAQYVQLDAVSSNIKQVLKDKAPQFMASVSALVNQSEALKECDKKSVLAACLTAASLDLPFNPSLGFAYVIPYKNKVKTTTTDDNGKQIVKWEQSSVAQFQLGYKGFVQLAMRSGQFQTLNVTDVKAGEITGNDILTGEINFNWLAGDARDAAATVGYVAYMRLNNGFTKMLYMTNEQLKQHGTKYSQTFKNGYGKWVDDFDGMARKTVLKLLLAKYAPMTVEMQKAQEVDQAVINDNGYEYPDNEKEPIDINGVDKSKEDTRVLAHIEQARTVKELQQCQAALNEATIEAYNTKMEKLVNKNEEVQSA